MKKTYLVPQVYIVKVLGQQPLAGSQVKTTDLDGFDGYGGVDEDGEKDPSARRRRDVWDDEEDEEW